MTAQVTALTPGQLHSIDQALLTPLVRSAVSSNTIDVIEMIREPAPPVYFVLPAVGLIGVKGRPGHLFSRLSIPQRRLIHNGEGVSGWLINRDCSMRCLAI